MFIIVAVLLYAGLVLAANRWKSYPLPFRFVEGYLLAFLCFDFLLRAFQGENFVFTGLVAIFGIMIGVAMEKRMRRESLWLVVIFLVILGIDRLAMPSVVCALFGGIGLYMTSNGLMPEHAQTKDVVQSAVGGSLGFILGVFLEML